MNRRLFLTALLACAVIGVGSSNAHAQMGYLSAVHGIPGLPEAVDVDITGPANVMFSFDYGDTFGPAPVPAGDYLIEVSLDGSVVLSTTATVMEDGNYTAVAHLNEDGSDIALSVFANEVSPLRWWFARLQIHHLAAAPTVDASIRRGRATWPKVELSGLSNGEQATATDVSAGNYNVGLLADDVEVFNTGKFKLRPGNNLAVYAVGVFPDTFQLIYLPLH
jgi:hypothetical protein